MEGGEGAGVQPTHDTTGTAEATGVRRGFGSRPEGGRGGRGRGGSRGGRGGRGGGPGGRGRDDKEWVPLTKLGRLVKNNMIKSLEEIYTHSIPIKESEIVEYFVEKSKKELSDEVMKIVSVQK
jgi:small subunit ribosomal protein S2e